jgi:flavin-dependent dehydrogenase
MRGAVLQLDKWGVLPEIIAAGTPPIHTTTFSYVEQEVVVPIEPRYGVSALYAPRRSLLDRVLVDAAVASGAEFAFGVHVDQRNAEGRVIGVVADHDWHIDAELVIGADGLRSTIARLAGARPILQGAHAAGSLYSYWEHFPIDGYYWRFRPGISMGVVPTNGSACCVFAGVSSERFARGVRDGAEAAYLRWLRKAAPEFAPIFDAGRRVEPVRGFAGMPGFIRTSTGPGWGLVGDASYFKDPATAHGITDALRDAELLARAILAGTSTALTSYEAARLELSKTFFQATDELVSFTRSDTEIQALHRTLSREMAREAQALAGDYVLVSGGV